MTLDRRPHRWLFGSILLIAALLAGSVHAAEAPSAAPPAATAANQPIDHGLRIFICGHSFHVGIRGCLPDVAAAAGIKDQQIIDCQFLGGSQVIQHWQLADKANKAKAALATGKIDVLTLSPHRRCPDEGIELFTDLALKHNPGIRILVQESWLPWDNPEARRPAALPDRNAATAETLLALHEPYYPGFLAQLEAINRKYGRQVVFVVPTGHALIALREKVRLGQAPGIAKQESLFVDDMGHPGPAVLTLNAYCHFAVIYRRTPVGIAPPPPMLKWSSAGDREPLNKLLQELAWDAVTKSPLSGVNAEAAK
jgi:hypothetical protein